MGKSKVYFTKDITPEAVRKLYDALGITLPGKVAVKLHSGEVGNQNFIRPDFWQPVIAKVNGTIVECNTAYEGKRNTTELHWETMKQHGWTEIADVDILDAEGEMELSVEDGKMIRKNYVGDHLKNYDSMLVLTHFKGHPMGGFGGSLKNISIGIASSHGKPISMARVTWKHSGMQTMIPFWNPWQMRQSPSYSFSAERWLTSMS